MNIDMLKAVFFLGVLKKEVLVVAGKQMEFPPATLLKYLIETDEKFWDDITKIADSLFEISVSVLSAGADNATSIFDVVNTAKSILKLPASQLLKELILLLPAHSGYAEASRKETQVNFSKLELAEFRQEIFNGNCAEQKKSVETFYKRREGTGEAQALANQWRRWTQYLARDISFEDLSYDLHVWKDVEKMMDIVRQYCRNLHLISIEARKFKHSIAIAVGLEESIHLSGIEAADDLICCAEPPTHLRSEEEKILFADFDTKKDVRGYAATSLSALVSAEMQLYVQCKLKFKKCKFCGRYFATRSSKAEYCKYPNAEYGDQTCQTIGPQHVYWRKKPLADIRQKNYKAYDKWMNCTISDDEKKMPAYMAEVRSELRRQYGKRKSDRAIKMVEREIRSVFATWNVNAEKMLERYAEGMITEEECRAALQVPPVPERSPLLASWDGVCLDINEDDLNRK